MDESLDLDLSWITEQESMLEHSQHIELKLLHSIPMTVFCVDHGYVSCWSTTEVPLDISGSECSVLASDKLVHIIQGYKKELNEQGKWTWGHGAVFHIDTDISHVYAFSATSGNQFLKPIDFCRDLVIAASPDIFHFSSQVYLFFEKQTTPPVAIKPILKTELRGKSTKKVHIMLPTTSLPKPIQKARRTRRAIPYTK
jgi:hypothetical protein